MIPQTSTFLSERLTVIGYISIKCIWNYNCIPLRNTQYPPGTRSTCIGLGPPCHYVLLCWNATCHRLPVTSWSYDLAPDDIHQLCHARIPWVTDAGNGYVIHSRLLLCRCCHSRQSKTPHSLLCSDVGINIYISAGLLGVFLESYPIIFISYFFFYVPLFMRLAEKLLLIIEFDL